MRTIKRACIAAALGTMAALAACQKTGEDTYTAEVPGDVDLDVDKDTLRVKMPDVDVGTKTETLVVKRPTVEVKPGSVDKKKP